MDITTRLREVPTMGHDAGCVEEAALEIEKLRMQVEHGQLLTNYWKEFYLHKGLCSLCGNCGIIFTRGIKTLAGFECGKENYCICPNGQHQIKQNALG